MGRNPLLIGLAGGSCSGKTTLARHLATRLGEEQAVRIGLDSYYYDLGHLSAEAIAAHNFDDPAALDRPLLFNQVEMLAAGETIEKPVYDLETHTRGGEPERIEPHRFVIIEGLFTLYWDDVRRHLKLGVFIDASHHVCLARRLARDQQERARTREEITHRYENHVTPMFDRHVYPTRRHADLVVDGTAPTADSVELILHIIDRLDARE